MPNPAIDPRRCTKGGCRAWRVKDSEHCVAHDPDTRALALAAKRLKRKGLRLPSLESVDAAKDWLKIIGEALAEDRIKASKAKELRLIATAYAAADPASGLMDRLDTLEGRMKRNGEDT